MIKVTVAFLGLLLLSASQVITPDPNPTLVGAYIPFDNFTDPSFKRVLDFVYKDHPQVKGWKPFNATVKYVSGTIYNFYLQPPKGASGYAYVSGIDDFVRKTVRILRYYPLYTPKPTPPSPTPSPHPIVFSNISSATVPTPKVTQPPKKSSIGSSVSVNSSYYSDFKYFSDYSNESFKKAYNQAKRQDNTLFQDNDFISVELYISSRFYYFRFTLKPTEDSTASTFQVYEVIAFENSTSESQHLVGQGESLNLSQTDVYKDAYNELLKAYPPLVRYTLASVKRQIVAGYNFFFVLESSEFVYEKIYATVFVGLGLDKDYDVKTTKNDFSIGYSLDVIDQVKSYALKKWAELREYAFYQAVNIRNDNTGLRLIYRSYSNKDIRYVDLDLVEGKETLTLNSP